MLFFLLFKPKFGFGLDTILIICYTWPLTIKAVLLVYCHEVLYRAVIIGEVELSFQEIRA